MTYEDYEKTNKQVEEVLGEDTPDFVKAARNVQMMEETLDAQGIDEDAKEDFLETYGDLSGYIDPHFFENEAKEYSYNQYSEKNSSMDEQFRKMGFGSITIEKLLDKEIIPYYPEEGEVTVQVMNDEYEQKYGNTPDILFDHMTDENYLNIKTGDLLRVIVEAEGQSAWDFILQKRIYTLEDGEKEAVVRAMDSGSLDYVAEMLNEKERNQPFTLTETTVKNPDTEELSQAFKVSFKEYPAAITEAYALETMKNMVNRHGASYQIEYDEKEEFFILRDEVIIDGEAETRSDLLTKTAVTAIVAEAAKELMHTSELITGIKHEEPAKYQEFEEMITEEYNEDEHGEDGPEFPEGPEEPEFPDAPDL